MNRKRTHVATVATLALAASAICRPAHARPDARPQDRVADTAPTLAKVTEEIVEGELWDRPELSPRDRSLVTVAALVSTGALPQLRLRLELAPDHGLTPVEISEIVTHLAFYSGWPNGLQAAGVVHEVFEARGIALEPFDPLLLQLDPRDEAARKAAVAASAGRVSAGLSDFTDRLLFGEIWRRSALAPRDRSLATVAALVATGQAEQLSFHLQRAMEHGLAEIEAGEVLTQLAFVSGWPRAFSAVGPMMSVFEKRQEPEETSVPDHLTVTRFEDGERFTGPSEHFTGDVRVESLFTAYPPGRAGGAMVHFEAGARTAWHTHPLGQVLIVTSGIGWVQSEAEARLTVHPGDVVRIPAGVRHWHGASAEQAMSHLAVLESLDGSSTTWMELVSDETYLDGAESSSGSDD